MARSVKAAGQRVVVKLVRGIFGDRAGRVLLPVLSGPARGMRFLLDFKIPIEKAYLLGRYDLPIVQHLPALCQKGWTVWDCGTYLGYYTALFAKLVGPTGQVVAFEPDMRNLRRTRQNVALNGFSNVRYVRTAIGAPMGEVELLVGSTTNSHISGAYIGSSPDDYRDRDSTVSTVRVPCMSLDQAYQNKNIPTPQLVKIDIEGAEKDALAHIDLLAREVRPLILLELHNPECDSAAWEFAKRTGYTLQKMPTRTVVSSREEVHGTLLCVPQN